MVIMGVSCSIGGDLRDLLSILSSLFAAVVGELFRRSGTARRLSGMDVLLAINMAANGRPTGLLSLTWLEGKRQTIVDLWDYVHSVP